MTGDDAVYWFLSGAAMDPTRIRQRQPEARFVARARLQTADGDAPVWGILLRLPADATPAPAAAKGQIVTDDGRAFAAVIASDPPQPGDAAALAAARYWELPPAYVRQLAGDDAVTAAG